MKSAQKIKQVEVDVKCMQTSFGEHGLSFWKFCSSSNSAKFPFRTMDYSPWGSKNRIGSKIEVDVGYNADVGFRDLVPFCYHAN